MNSQGKSIARVVIDSPLPQLDRVFDYQVAPEIQADIAIGQRVKVAFGRGGSAQTGYVVELTDKSEFDGKLGVLSELVSKAAVLTPEIYKLARAVADRQAAPVSEVIRLAIPNRSVAVENKWLAGQQLSLKNNALTQLPSLQTALMPPVSDESGPAWVAEFVARAEAATVNFTSTIIAVPDFRDQKLLIAALIKAGLADSLIDFSSSLVGSKRYENFLKTLSLGNCIVVGSRAALYAPVNNLSQILVWDDGDPSHLEQASPYSHSREVALIRQSQTGCSLFFAGHARSTEVQRLVTIGFLKDVTKPFRAPSVAVSDAAIRVDSMAWTVIRKGLETGPVLVQVASRGTATSAYCKDCDERAKCSICNGPLWLDEKGQAKCRWCNALNLDFQCQGCSGRQLRQGRPGATRTVAEFGKAFPGAQIVEANADSVASKIGKPNTLVVSTPGAEPNATNGYSAVVILDSNVSLSKDSLKATEDSVRIWSNAIALLGPNGQSVIVGLVGELAKNFALWNQIAIAEAELRSRQELRFPPALRIASVTAGRELLHELLDQIRLNPKIEILGPIPIASKDAQDLCRALLRFDYSAGLEVAKFLKAQSLLLSAGQVKFSSRSGRAQRPIRIKMDDAEVI